MENFSSHLHHHRPSLPVALPHSPGLGYPSSQSVLDPPEPCGNRGGFLWNSSISPGGRGPSVGEDRGLPHTSGSSMDGDATRGGDGIGTHFHDAWCMEIKREEVWGGCEGAADDFSYGNTNNCHLKADINNYVSRVSHEASHLAKQATSFIRGGTGSDGSGDYCQTDLRGRDCLGREEDFGPSSGSGEGQTPSALVEEPWISTTSSSETRTGAADTNRCPRAPISQKLDSFSEAFLSQRGRTFPIIPSRDSSGQLWENPSFDSDCYLPASSSSSPIFPSVPTSSHLMPSVLSPPPTPRPPPALSPPKIDSAGAFRAPGYPASQGGASLDVLQFFTSHLQALPSIHSSGMIWKFPLLAHGFSQPSSDADILEGDLRSSHGGGLGSVAGPRNILSSPESSFLTSLHSPSTPCPPGPSSFHPAHPSLHHEAAVKPLPYMLSQNGKNGSGSQLPQLSQIYTGTPFPSILHSSRAQMRGRFTPQPLLNPSRRGLGLYSSLASLHHRREEKGGGEEEERSVFPCVNVGQDFQAELPLCFEGSEESWSPEEESQWEQLLWKPLDSLEGGSSLPDEVDRLLAMCRSSCLPGGGSNTELALHCLHRCRGNTLETLGMLLFSQPPLTGSYHYPGSDIWTDSEKVLFSAALGTYGKDFSLIQKTVRTKTSSQCVEYFYLSKKLQDKRTKQKEEGKDGEMELQGGVTPTGQRAGRKFELEVPFPAPSLASFFPCKLCGKMFYKIKSRNAHMKIHRQTQEDWSDRHQQLLAQHLGGSLLPPQAPVINNSNAVLNSTFTPSCTRVPDPSNVVTYGNAAMPNSHVITTIDEGGATTAPPFSQVWGSFGRSSAPATFSCITEQKDEERGGQTDGNGPIRWQ